jgi:putative acetyltransferase
MSEYTIIEYSEEYQEVVKEFVIAAHEEFGFPYNQDLDADLENPSIFYKDRGGVLYLLLDGTRLIGTVAVKNLGDGAAELKRMYLNKMYRGQGLGQRLLDHALVFCRERSFKRVVLDTNIQQVDAQKFYGRNGFQIDKTVKNAIFMSKDL